MSEEAKRCRECGAIIPTDAKFCPSCGAAVAPQPIPPAAAAPPPRREYRGEKQEKGEKREKEEKDEKAEKKGGDRTGAVTGGLVLIWLGISFYLAQTRVISWSVWWAYFLTGLGVIIIVNGLIRYSEYRYNPTGAFIGGAVMIVIGLTVLMGVRDFWQDFWPVILIIIGAVVIISGLTARSRAQRP
ncbi:MAG: zinc ribbon domain-containing protein [Thaumarchaeota archaeon]|nr:zinc ribbon domain-containing protein [Nitrososphaerota archaeon]MCL5318394.1 zinc ribbon domain-containing protein [Nitrososphaerota archaeon]